MAPSSLNKKTHVGILWPDFQVVWRQWHHNSAIINPIVEMQRHRCVLVNNVNIIVTHENNTIWWFLLYSLWVIEGNKWDCSVQSLFWKMSASEKSTFKKKWITIKTYMLTSIFEREWLKLSYSMCILIYLSKFLSYHLTLWTGNAIAVKYIG